MGLGNLYRLYKEVLVIGKSKLNRGFLFKRSVLLEKENSEGFFRVSDGGFFR